MKIYIPTYGRAEKQVTLDGLPVNLLKYVTLVVQQRDTQNNVYGQYLSRCKLTVLPDKIRTIGATRQWIVENHDRRKDGKDLIMLDDDIRFDWRRHDDPGKFFVAKQHQIMNLFKDIQGKLFKHAHVGVLAREGGNRVTEKYIYATRMMRVLAYDVDVLRREKIKFNRIELMEDFDVTLQLLRAGYDNCVICSHVNGQGSSNAAGGCSSYRTLELHAKAANQLATLHAPFVKLVTKQTKGAWGGKERTDVMIQWKKAYESSQRK